MRTTVYVDGFNLYYGCLKYTAFKWLNIYLLCQAELPAGTEIQKIRYFTARVRGEPQDPRQPFRQETYLRALQTLPGMELHFGRYVKNKCKAELVAPLPGTAGVVEVWKPEEKGSDVNLASHLLLDAARGRCDAAVVVSNDTDLAEPLRLVRDEFRLPVTIIHPCRFPRKPSHALKCLAHASVAIRNASLAASQFPPRLFDSAGVIEKPASWDTHIWCHSCQRVFEAFRWSNNSHRCPGCSNRKSDAWSVLRVDHPEYPLRPWNGAHFIR